MTPQTKNLIKYAVSTSLAGASYISVWMSLRLMSDMECESFKRDINRDYYVSEIKRKEDLKKINKLNFVTRIGAWSTGIGVGTFTGYSLLNALHAAPIKR